MLDIVREQEGQLEFASDKLKADKEVVFAAVQWDGASLQFADKTLQDDQDIVLEAIDCNQGFGLYGRLGVGFTSENHPMIYATYRLVSSKEFMLKAVKIEPYSLEYLSTELKSDKELFFEANKRHKDLYSGGGGEEFFSRNSVFLEFDDSVSALKALEFSNSVFFWF